MAEKNKGKIQAGEAVAARKAYALSLREKFLDDGVDIKVSVSGSAATKLKLEYVLFNDVWTHKFQKGSLMQEIGRLGFKEVHFDDGYDYAMVLTFEK